MSTERFFKFLSRPMRREQGSFSQFSKHFARFLWRDLFPVLLMLICLGLLTLLALNLLLDHDPVPKTAAINQASFLQPKN